MKRTPLLNRHLSRLAAELGHMDEIVVADAGLPCPARVEVIDLSLTPGVPSFFNVLDALETELVFETATFATETSDNLSEAIKRKLKDMGDVAGKEITVARISHDALKARSSSARAIIRTGECTPYANIIMTSGVPF